MTPDARALAGTAATLLLVVAMVTSPVVGVVDIAATNGTAGNETVGTANATVGNATANGTPTDGNETTATDGNATATNASVATTGPNSTADTSADANSTAGTGFSIERVSPDSVATAGDAPADDAREHSVLRSLDTGTTYGVDEDARLSEADVPDGEYLHVTYRRGEVVERERVTIGGTQRLGTMSTSTESGPAYAEVLVPREYDTTYARSETAQIWVNARDGDPSAGASEPLNTMVTVNVSRPDGVVDSFEVNTSENGVGLVEYDLDGKPTGAYRVAPDAGSYRSSRFYVGNQTRLFPDIGSLTQVGEQTQYGGIVTSGHEPVSGAQAQVLRLQPNGTVGPVYLPADADGVFSGTFTPQLSGAYELETMGSARNDNTRFAVGEWVARLSVNGWRFGSRGAPGDEVAITGTVRRDGAPYTNASVVVQIGEITSVTVQNITVTTNERGQFHTTWTVPETATESSYFDVRLYRQGGERIRTNDPYLNVDEFKSGDTASPSLEIISDASREVGGVSTDAVAPGGAREVLVRFTDAAGGPVANETVRFVASFSRGSFRLDTNTVTTDENGEAAVTFPVPELAPTDVELEITASATHNGTTLRETVSTPVRQYAWESRFDDGVHLTSPGERIRYTVTGVNLTTGEPAVDVPVATSFETDDTFRAGAVDVSAQRTNASGGATFEVQTPTLSNSYQLAAQGVAPGIPDTLYSVPVSPYDVRLNGLTEFETMASPGETLTFNYTTTSDTPTKATVTVATPSPIASDRVLYSDVVAAGENVSVTVPDGAVDDTRYDVQIAVVNETGTAANRHFYGALTINSTVESPDVSETLLVGAGDDADYATIQAAVDNASAGDTVRVAAGTYREQVTVDEAVDIVADGDVTLNGSEFTDRYAAAFSLRAPATVRGFTITDYPQGITASEYDDDWTVRNLTLRDNGEGIRAPYSRGNWTVLDSAFRSNGLGINAYVAEGDWTVRNTTITGSAGQDGYSPYDAMNGTGIYAADTSGAWTVRESAFVNNARVALNATGASPRGDARRNWWGGFTPGEACTGNLTCAVSIPFPPENPPPNATVPFSTEFADGLGNWYVNQRYRTSTHREPGAGEHPYDLLNRGDGAWVNGTVRLNVQSPPGEPSTIGVARNTSGIPAGTQITARYRTGTLDSEDAGNVKLVLYPPGADSEGIVLNQTNSGVVSGTVEEVMPPGTEVRVAADVWPGEYTVRVTEVSATPEPTNPVEPTLVVDADGEYGSYTSIQPAIDDASAGDTVRVHPGVYPERLNLSKNVTLSSVEGTPTLSGSNFANGAAVTVSERAEPTLDGFEIRGYPTGLDATESAGAWTVWRTQFVENDVGIDANRSTGDWTLRAVTVQGSGSLAVAAVESAGDWSVLDTGVIQNPVGVRARSAAGNWTVRGSELFGTTSPADARAALDASGATGAWEATYNQFTNNAGPAVYAPNATTGNATRNWWNSPEGPGGDFVGDGDGAVGEMEVRPFFTDSTLDTLSEPPETLTAAVDLLPGLLSRGATTLTAGTVRYNRTVGGEPAADPFYVVVRTELGGAMTAVGASDDLAPGEHADVEINLRRTLSPDDTLDAVRSDRTFEAVLYNATTGEPVRANATDTADVSVPDPPEFTVTDLTNPLAVQAGDTVSLAATVENTGGVAGTQQVQFRLDNYTEAGLTDEDTVATASLSLDAGENATVTRTVSTDRAVPAVTGISVAAVTANDTATGVVDVAGPPTADVRFGNATVPHGTEEVTIDATNYTGGTHYVTVRRASGNRSAPLGVSAALGDGANTDVAVELEESLTANATLVATLRHADDGAVGDPIRRDGTAVTDSARHTVLPPANLTVTAVRPDPLVTAGNDAAIEATVENTGGPGSDTVAVSFDRDGDYVLEADERAASRTLSLDGGETRTLTFRVGTEGAEAGLHKVGVRGDGPFRTGVVVVRPDFDIPEPPEDPDDGGGSGDPHMTTFDGVGYDFQAAGEYVLAREPNGTLSVQTRLVPMSGRDVSAIEAAATALDGHNVTIDAADETPLTVDGERVSLGTDDNVSVGDGAVFRRGNTYTVVYPGADDTVDDGDGRLRVDLWGDRADASLALNGSFRGHTEGLLGSADGNASNDIAYPDGTVLERPLDYRDLYGPFREAYRVTEGTTRFDYDGNESVGSFFIEDYPSSVVTVASLDPELREEARAYVIERGLQPGTPAFEDAVLDYALTNDESYVESAARAAATTNATTDATPDAAVVFGNRSVENGTHTLTVNRTTYTGGPYRVALQRANDGNRSEPLGVSAELGTGTHDAVTVDLDAPLTANATLVATLRPATETGLGAPIEDGGTVVTDTAAVTLRPAVLSVSFDTDTLVPGTTATASVDLDTGGRNVTGANGTLAYNASALNLTSWRVARDSPVEGGGSFDPDAGTLTFGALSDPTVDGPDVVTVTFRVRDNATPGTVALALSDASVSGPDGALPTRVANDTARIPENIPPRLEATLRASVLNAGSPVPALANASDRDGTVSELRFLGPNASTSRSCDAPNCTAALSVTPGNATWNGSGYANVTFEVVAEDDGGALNATRFSSPVYAAGDATGDGAVDIYDATVLGTAWRTERGDGSYTDAADLTNDGEVDIYDAALVGLHWGEAAE